MYDDERLAELFEAQRRHLHSVAYRMLGSITDADDAVQDTWLRVSRADTQDVDNPAAWLTTIVARVSLNILRSRRTRPEQPLDAHVPDPIVDSADTTNPEHETLLADSVGLALLVVLETLTPAERLAFVLHDMFGIPFEEIAPIVERSPPATRQLASRARRRVRVAPVPDADLNAQWTVVEAFLAASRDGDFDALVAVLDPDVVLRVDGGAAGASRYLRGADTIARQALMFRRPGLSIRRALINGAAGLISMRAGELIAVWAGVVKDGTIVEINILTDPERLDQLDIVDVVTDRHDW
jgi:RNA polymerase sigma factor (sigma-70 family)